MKKINFIWLLLCVLLSSCFKKEKPITLPIGNSQITSFFMGEGNNNRTVYFELSSNLYQVHQPDEWDIKFDAKPNGMGVFSNSGNSLIIRKIDIYNLDEPKANDTNYFKTIKQTYEYSTGNIKQSAIGDWKSYVINDTANGRIKNGIYIIELPYYSGKEKYKRLQILNTNDSAYSIRISELYEYNAKPIEIKKNNLYNFVYYSFKNGGKIVPNAEPPKDLWDLEFSLYQAKFFPFDAYPVRGVLINPNKVEVYRDSAGSVSFQDIDANYVQGKKFSTNRDIIGYNWKDYDFNGSGLYSINHRIIYIIKDVEGAYYKLRFLDYYNEKGKQGYPKFEFIRIK